VQVKKLKLYQIVEATCQDIVSEGLGLCHIKATGYIPLTGFVLGVMPGETFLAKVTRVKSNHFHGVVLPLEELPEGELLQEDLDSNEPEWIGKNHNVSQVAHEKWAIFNPAPERRKPDCENFTYCGSCKLLHMSYEKTLFFKKNWLTVQLQRNHVDPPEIQVIESPRKINYRNHVQIHINKYEKRGFYAPYSYTTREFPEAGCLLFDQKSVDQKFPQELKLEKCVRSRIDYLKSTVGIWSLYSKEEKNELFTYHIEYPPESLTSVTIPNSSFFQTNTSMIPAWLREIQSLIHLSGKSTDKIHILELFSGFGFISKMVSFSANIEALGIDILHPRDLKKIKISNNTSKKNIPDLTQLYIQHDLTLLDRISPENKEKIRTFKPDIIIINPPRSGFIPLQMDFLFKSILPDYSGNIIYSSCNGATFARDCVSLQKHQYHISALTLLDFFPWTSHYEVLGFFKKKMN